MDWQAAVDDAHSRLTRRGHVDPVVAVTTAAGRFAAGDPRERFEIGSITKVFTGLLLADLVRSDVVALDARVPEFLPAGIAVAPGLESVTLEHLATHRSGLPRLPPGLWRRSFTRGAMADPYADIDEDRLLASLAATKVRGKPGEVQPGYSNYGMGLLGYLLGRATGVGYESSVATRVIAPLAMTSTDFSDENLHQGRHRRRPVGPWHLAALAGAGGLRSSAADLLTLLESIRDPQSPLADAFVEAIRPRGKGTKLRTGLGWFILGDDDRGLLMHNGGTLGARSEVRLETQTGVGAVVLGDSRRGTGSAAASLLKPR